MMVVVAASDMAGSLAISALLPLDLAQGMQRRGCTAGMDRCSRCGAQRRAVWAGGEDGSR